MHFAYDLKELGRYYNRYEEIMAHWDSVLPEGRVYHIQYENVVEDLESEARKLIAHCGLEWNESRLAFHENKRHVKTASIAQVRQPIYKSSKARWKKYEPYIQDLLIQLMIAILNVTES